MDRDTKVIDCTEVQRSEVSEIMGKWVIAFDLAKYHTLAVVTEFEGVSKRFRKYGCTSNGNKSDFLKNSLRNWGQTSILLKRDR